MKVLILTSLSAVLTSISVPAATVYDSITSGTLGGANTTITGPNSGYLFFNIPVSVPDHEVAVRFQTGNLSASFDQIEFALNGITVSSTAPVSVSLSSGPVAPGGLASTPLGTAVPSGSSSTEILTITPSIPVPLAANTSYWLHFTTSGSDPLYSLASILGGSPAGPWSVSEVSVLQPNTSPNWTTQSGVVPALRIQGTESIPEPSSTLICSLSLLTPLLRRRRTSSIL